MRKETKQAFKELLEVTRKNLNDLDNFEISKFAPEVGVQEDWERDCDDEGNWGFRTVKYNITEEQALEEGQYRLLMDENKGYFEDFLFESEIRGKILNFMKCICKENM